MTFVRSIVVAFIGAVVMASCTPDNPDPKPEPYSNDSIPADTVPVAKKGFAHGADISWATEMEDRGCQFYTADGKPMECTALMKEIGFNAVRFRVWVNPTGKYNTIADVLLKARRARDLGMDIMIDFHYSDS